jgi:hypothetical protein
VAQEGGGQIGFILTELPSVSQWANPKQKVGKAELTNVTYCNSSFMIVPIFPQGVISLLALNSLLECPHCFNVVDHEQAAFE